MSEEARKELISRLDRKHNVITDSFSSAVQNLPVLADSVDRAAHVEAAASMRSEKFSCEPPLSETATNLEVNRDGSMILAWGETSCQVVLIKVKMKRFARPKRHGYDNDDHDDNDNNDDGNDEEKSHGQSSEPEFYYESDTVGTVGKNRRLLKAGWHPMSKHHVLMLTEDNVLAMYKIGESKPELVLQDIPPGCVDFAFNRPDGWEAMAVYLVDAGGSVFTICPIIPDGIVLRERRLGEMFALAELKNDGGDDGGDVRGQQYRAWLVELQRIWRRVPALAGERKKSEYLCAQTTGERARAALRKVAFQMIVAGAPEPSDDTAAAAAAAVSPAFLCETIQGDAGSKAVGGLPVVIVGQRQRVAAHRAEVRSGGWISGLVRDKYVRGAFLAICQHCAASVSIPWLFALQNARGGGGSDDYKGQAPSTGFSAMSIVNVATDIPKTDCSNQHRPRKPSYCVINNQSPFQEMAEPLLNKLKDTIRDLTEHINSKHRELDSADLDDPESLKTVAALKAIQDVWKYMAKASHISHQYKLEALNRMHFLPTYMACNLKAAKTLQRACEIVEKNNENLKARTAFLATHRGESLLRRSRDVFKRISKLKSGRLSAAEEAYWRETTKQMAEVKVFKIQAERLERGSRKLKADYEKGLAPRGRAGSNLGLDSQEAARSISKLQRLIRKQCETIIKCKGLVQEIEGMTKSLKLDATAKTPLKISRKEPHGQ
eukprot:jgi/Bigna1/84016/fgenesh1_pg.120_\